MHGQQIVRMFDMFHVPYKQRHSVFMNAILLHYGSQYIVVIQVTMSR